MSTELIAIRPEIRIGPGMVGLVGATPTDSELLEALPTETDLKLVVTVPRNLKFHKKFFALLKVVYDYMDEDTRLANNIWSTTELLNRLKIDLGLYDLHIMGAGGTLPEGTPVYIPRSISFTKMDDSKFSQFYKGVIGVAIAKYVTNQTEAAMMEAVDRVLRFE